MALKTPEQGPDDATITTDGAPPRAPAGEFTLGRGYRLGKLLGEGGMGAVYQATDPDGRPLAIKMIRGEHDGAARRRFAREVKAMTSVVSPHVVRVFDADAGDQGSPFLVMELLDGKDLASLIREQGPLDPALAARIFVQACRGLAAIHARGIVHRDIKPSNLFLHRLGGELCLKICDFGIAKTISADSSSTELTRSGGIIGSPHYMSPEQLQDAKRVGAGSDLWSLSAALFEALSGQKLWAGLASVSEVLVAVCTRDPPWLQEKAPWIPANLAALVHRNLRRRPSERFASAAEMADALEPLAAPPGALIDLPSLALSDQAKAVQAAPAPPEARSDPARTRGSPARPRGRPLALTAGAALAALLASGFYAARPGQESAPSTSGQLRVPPLASVWIQGKPGTNAAGIVTLRAPPGEPISVSVEHLGARAERVVTLTSRGQVVPEEIALEPAPSATASAAPPASISASAQASGIASAALTGASAGGAASAPAGASGRGLRPASSRAAAPERVAAPTATAAPGSSGALQIDKTW